MAGKARNRWERHPVARINHRFSHIVNFVVNFVDKVDDKNNDEVSQIKERRKLSVER